MNSLRYRTSSVIIHSFGRDTEYQWKAAGPRTNPAATRNSKLGLDFKQGHYTTYMVLSLDT